MGTMAKKTFLSTSRNGKVERPCAFIRGPLAVARPIGDDKSWMVGHVATGMSCGGIRYRSVQRAKSALLDMLPITDWNDPRLLDGDAKFLGKEVFHKILSVASKHGGVNLFGMPIEAPGGQWGV